MSGQQFIDKDYADPEHTVILQWQNTASSTNGTRQVKVRLGSDMLSI